LCSAKKAALQFLNSLILLVSCLSSLNLNVYGKEDFAEAFKNLARYRSENNFVEPNNYIRRSN